MDQSIEFLNQFMGALDTTAEASFLMDASCGTVSMRGELTDYRVEDDELYIECNGDDYILIKDLSVDSYEEESYDESNIITIHFCDDVMLTVEY